MGEIISLILLRTPKYEAFLPPDERGVSVSHESFPEEDDRQYLRRFTLLGSVVTIETTHTRYQLAPYQRGRHVARHATHSTEIRETERELGLSVALFGRHTHAVDVVWCRRKRSRKRRALRMLRSATGLKRQQNRRTPKEALHLCPPFRHDPATTTLMIARGRRASWPRRSAVHVLSPRFSSFADLVSCPQGTCASWRMRWSGPSRSCGRIALASMTCRPRSARRLRPIRPPARSAHSRRSNATTLPPHSGLRRQPCQAAKKLGIGEATLYPKLKQERR